MIVCCFPPSHPLPVHSFPPGHVVLVCFWTNVRAVCEKLLSIFIYLTYWNPATAGVRHHFLSVSPYLTAK